VVVSSVAPQLRTTDLDASILFYTEKVGLSLEFRHSNFYAAIRAGDSVFHLKLVDEPDPSISYVEAQGHLHLYFGSRDVDALAAKLRANGVTLLQDPHDTNWGTREFAFRDDQGHTIYAGRPR
jgi:catechol 2,3-dioxygenase-like lactoylglutathione lyase family enzyme